MDDIFTFGVQNSMAGGGLGQVRESQRNRGERKRGKTDIQRYREIERHRNTETQRQRLRLRVKGQVSSGQVVLGQDRLKETFSTF